MVAATQLASDHNMPFMQQRCDLAAAFRWAERLNMHEAVANHFSLAVDDSGKRFLMNPNQRHFSRIKASDILLLDADDPATRVLARWNRLAAIIVAITRRNLA